MPYGNDPAVRLGWCREREDWEYLSKTAARGWQQHVAAVNKKPLGIAKWFRQDDQNGFGSCVGHGVTGCAEVIYWLETGKVAQFSRWGAYITTQDYDGINYDGGATISSAQRMAMEIGFAPESLCPYPNRYHRQIPKEYYDAAKKTLIQQAYAVDSYEDILLGLQSGLGAALIGMTWTNQMSNAGPVIESFKGGYGGGHCVCWVDWSEKLDSEGRPYLLMPNSHGMWWGENGMALCSPRMVTQVLNAQWSEVRILSDLTTPVSRCIDYEKELFP